MNSTTLAQAGTSLSQIQQNATAAAAGAINPIEAQKSLSDPIEQMRQYALANTSSTGLHDAINNAALDAGNRMDASFTTSLTGVNHSLFDIQNGAGEAMSSGVSAFSDSLKSINSSIVDSALTVGNSGLVKAREFSDATCTATYNAATNSVADQVLGTNNALADRVQAENAAARAAIGATPIEAAANGVFSNAGVWAGSEDSTPSGANTTDVIYQDVKLYIEGVQVPYEAISISQNIGTLPSAVVQIPPQSGLMDIARYYQPKVHIFYTDKNVGGDRLLFWGHIAACNYAKSRQGSGMSTISFRCVHKNALLEQVTLEWSNYVNNVMATSDPNTNQVTSQVAAFNSKQSLVSALKGLTGMQTEDKDLISPKNDKITEADVTKLDQRWANFQKRLLGMPAASMNLWNQLKKTCYTNKDLNTVMSRIYIPLVEDGIAFFDRLAGHYSLEKIIDDTKQVACIDRATPSEREVNAMVPPSFRLPSISAISSTMAMQAISNQLGFSGEMSSFVQLFQDFYLAVEYEMITLASPAHVPVDPTVTVNSDDPSSSATIPMMAIETIVKPQIPFYYSPLCNVLLPKMYHTISIDQDEMAVPTRVTAFHDSFADGRGAPGTNYRGPQSIREAIAIGSALVSGNGSSSSTPPSLANTRGSSYNIPGKYEQGRGVLHRKVIMPYWLGLLVDSKNQTTPGTDEEWPAKGTSEYNDLMNLYAAWVDRYGYDVVINDDVVTKTRNTDKDALNPYSKQAHIHAHERLLFMTADYDFTKQVAQARNGSIEAIFNPYIVPGYPMDVIDESPNHPSFHGLCVSVTHSITSRSIGTSISMVGAMTYSEMSNYYLQPLHPWLQTALKLINVTWDNNGSDSDTVPASSTDEFGDVSKMKAARTSLIGNPNAKAAADEFYRSVFGIAAASPDQIYDFSLGQAIPIARQNRTWGVGTAEHLPMPNGGEGNDFLTTVGNLRLVCRPIEGRRAIESKFGVKFIDLIPENYSQVGPTYQNPILSSDLLLEPGASMFLEYDETKDFVKAARDMVNK